MSKIYNMIPGCQVNYNSIEDRILALIGSIKFDKWIDVSKEIYSLEF